MKERQHVQYGQTSISHYRSSWLKNEFDSNCAAEQWQLLVKSYNWKEWRLCIFSFLFLPSEYIFSLSPFFPNRNIAVLLESNNPQHWIPLLSQRIFGEWSSLTFSFSSMTICPKYATLSYYWNISFSVTQTLLIPVCRGLLCVLSRKLLSHYTSYDRDLHSLLLQLIFRSQCENMHQSQEPKDIFILLHGFTM